MAKQLTECMRCHMVFNPAARTDYLPPSALTCFCPGCCREMKQNHRRAERFNRLKSSLAAGKVEAASAKFNEGKKVLSISEGGICICSFCGEEVKQHNCACPHCGSFVY